MQWGNVIKSGGLKAKILICFYYSNAVIIFPFVLSGYWYFAMKWKINDLWKNAPKAGLPPSSFLVINIEWKMQIAVLQKMIALVTEVQIFCLYGEHDRAKASVYPPV